MGMSKSTRMDGGERKKSRTRRVSATDLSVKVGGRERGETGGWHMK